MRAPRFVRTISAAAVSTTISRSDDSPFTASTEGGAGAVAVAAAAAGDGLAGAGGVAAGAAVVVFVESGAGGGGRNNACYPYITRAPSITAIKILRSMDEITRGPVDPCAGRVDRD